MAVALKDLEIRGAGNLLGGEQSGHIADVGFDLYVRLVGEALADFKAGTGADGQRGEPEQADVKVELPLDAHLPEDYVPGERLRLQAYRRLAAVTSDADLEEVRAELVDRYGPLPAPVETLLGVAQLRLLARAYGVTDIGLAGRYVRLSPVDLPESARLRLTRLYPGSVIKQTAHTIQVPRPASAPVGGEPLRDDALLAWVRELIERVLPSPTATSTAGTALPAAPIPAST
jgi:transcription-repair coupling factor (superfamily II helicase)